MKYQYSLPQVLTALDYAVLWGRRRAAHEPMATDTVRQLEEVKTRLTTSSGAVDAHGYTALLEENQRLRKQVDKLTESVKYATRPDNAAGVNAEEVYVALREAACRRFGVKHEDVWNTRKRVDRYVSVRHYCWYGAVRCLGLAMGEVAELDGCDPTSVRYGVRKVESDLRGLKTVQIEAVKWVKSWCERRSV